MNEMQNPKQSRFEDWRLEFGIYLGIGICDLEF
jgi:hypothetical protein